MTRAEVRYVLTFLAGSLGYVVGMILLYVGLPILALLALGWEVTH